ncbi:Hsp20 family protein [Candidatus Saccharibacteria bacterium]|nr:Hsp20/alpha crystallin family protein [Candidatus Saccharibacteria bacterium]NIV03523.1 Hsp20 family protein [Calditrichia bacterium]NIV71765.1 Hsp20 family protein [Calditrichia bacterium]NIV98463.1 Hsp20 family protein [Candidatus Saccharibacteria bacterium]NIW80035.1 Hsp20 family protein [Calditrichia bacterium]
MAIIPWSPFWPWEEMEKAFHGHKLPAKAFPMILPADVYETAKTVEVKMPIAGVEPEKVDISVKDNVLTVKGKSEKKTEVEEKNYYRKEIRSGSFHRSLPLPVAVLGNRACAQSEHGMLRISIPKAPVKPAKKVKVKVRAEKKPKVKKSTKKKKKK